MQAELNRMVNVEMVNLSKELAKASDIAGDVRENVEYNALMEKQATLKITINRLDIEIKKAEVLNPDKISIEKVNIGTKVIYTDENSNEENYYVILGPWDADFGKRILSYRSPIAKAFLGKAVNDKVVLQIGEEKRNLVISSIQKFN